MAKKVNNSLFCTWAERLAKTMEREFEVVSADKLNPSPKMKGLSRTAFGGVSSAPDERAGGSFSTAKQIVRRKEHLRREYPACGGGVWTTAWLIYKFTNLQILN